MNLVGEIILGQLGKRSEHDRLLGHGTSTTLIYGEHGELEPVSVFGAHCDPASKGDTPPPFLIQDFESDITEAYVSWAPLSGIQSIRTFYNKDAGLCMGIIFYYENGGLRAVGQCRRYVDYSTLAVQPSVLCYQSTIERHSVRVEVGSDVIHQHVGNGWKCLVLGDGVLTFSFTESWSYISQRIQWP